MRENTHDTNTYYSMNDSISTCEIVPSAHAHARSAITREPSASPGRGRKFRMEGEYTGHVKDGKVHGVGVCVYTDGSRYHGDWKAGLKCGRGTHSFASGDQFEGEWENGWMHGLGVYTWKIGDKYIGEVHYGRIHGFDTYTWRTNSKCATGLHDACFSLSTCGRCTCPLALAHPRRSPVRHAGTLGSGRTGACTAAA